jgi:dTDP-4-dehydrorhamnose reductase
LVGLIKSRFFSIIINACALVDHRLCEVDKESAYRINARPSSILAQITRETNSKYVFISTDGYYHGDKDLKHGESAPVQLLNEYARSKYAGECFAMTNPDSLVVRTNIVGFKGKKNKPTFLEWVIESLQTGIGMTLFTDYYTSSISVAQFSCVLCDLLASRPPSGILNIAGAHVSSKAQFIRKLAHVFDLEPGNCKEDSVDSLVDSRRANSLGLDVSRVEKIVGYAMPDLDQVLAQLKQEYDELGY